MAQPNASTSTTTTGWKTALAVTAVDFFAIRTDLEQQLRQP